MPGSDKPPGSPTYPPAVDSGIRSQRRSGPFRVLVADDYESVREGVCAVLESRSDIEVCAQAKNGEEAVEKALRFKPDMIILDISMPGFGGVEAARQIRVLSPEAPILFFTMHNVPQLFAIAKSVGVQGFVTKDQMATTLLEAVDALRRNETYFSLGTQTQRTP
jgi:DNA-binding NarL/FixJ family response regulator